MTRHSVSMVKSGQRFIFVFDDDCRAELISAFAKLAADPESIFDWFDAAILTYQVGQRPTVECQ